MVYLLVCCMLYFPQLAAGLNSQDFSYHGGDDHNGHFTWDILAYCAGQHCYMQSAASTTVVHMVICSINKHNNCFPIVSFHVICFSLSVQLDSSFERPRSTDLGYNGTG